MSLSAFLQYGERALGILGSLISIATFVAVIRVRSKVREYHQIDKFHTQRQRIIDELEGYSMSIIDNNLTDETIRNDIYKLLLELQTYTIFSRGTRRLISKSIESLDPSKTDWKIILGYIIKLKSRLEGEL